jgi:hypothetical protein
MFLIFLFFFSSSSPVTYTLPLEPQAHGGTN